MNENLTGITTAFPDLRVLVIGEAMLDSYLTGTSERLCREAPVPVVTVDEREHVPGGAANTAVNVHSLGSQVFFLSVCGEDAEGDLLREALLEKGVAADDLLTHPGRRTLSKQRVMAASQMVVRFDQGSTEDLDEEYEDRLVAHLCRRFRQADAVIVSDYNYGILTPHVIQVLAELQKDAPRPVIVDSRRLHAYRDLRAAAVKPNYEEALRLLGRLERDKRLTCQSLTGRVEKIETCGSHLIELTGAEIVVVSLDQEGALVFERDQAPYRTYARPAPDSRAAGAGDTFVSALTLALAAGAHTAAAAELASAAASVVVRKTGTAACTLGELRSYFSTDEKYMTDVFQVAARIAAYRQENRRIVFTNGCFDILHRGHINYLNRAKALGDVLIVGMNSDSSVRRLKGPQRPINALEDRAQILAALSCVDHIVAFDGDTPHELIRVIRPDIFVKGGDYTRETLPEASLVESLGGQVHILPYLPEHSTTNIIERIRRIYAPRVR